MVPMMRGRERVRGRNLGIKHELTSQRLLNS